MTIIAFNRYWVVSWPWVFVNFVVVLFLLGLSLWQWQRGEEKRETLNRIATWRSQAAVNLDKFLTIAAPERDGVQIDFLARWLSPRVWLLDNRMLDGRIGYDVIIAVQEVSQTQKSSVILVNLGWVAAPVSRNFLPDIAIPETLHVQGVYRNSAQGVLLGENIEDGGTWPMRIQQVDPVSLSRYVDSEIISGLIYQEENSPFVVHYHPVILPPERHKAYALQWFLLAIAVIVIAVVASARKTHRNNKADMED
jgi:surfeit locus 1 family protein